jgi:hypothetical protein
MIFWLSCQEFHRYFSESLVCIKILQVRKILIQIRFQIDYRDDIVKMLQQISQLQTQ